MTSVAWSGPKLRVAVLGATGSVGQRFVSLLADHPWFEIGALCASERSAGHPYADAVRWMQTTALPPEIGSLEIRPTESASANDCVVAFSALDATIATPVEQEFARAGHVVVSNAGAYRMHPRVPLVVPEVNADHLELLAGQEFGDGAIVTNPNCSTIGLVLPLKPLVDRFGLLRVHVVTLQALSGAGIEGIPSMQMVDNIVPFISGEEEKIESETRKILGRVTGGEVTEHEVMIGAQCNRVPVLDGHTACVSVELGDRPPREDLLDAWAEFVPDTAALALPSAPKRVIHVLEGDDVPQPRLHRDTDGGMAALVGRVRPCPLLSWKFVTLSHNTLRGAAGGALLLGELAVARGVVPGWSAGGKTAP